MAICELCGKNSDLFNVIVEGVKLNVCSSCSGHGKIIKKLEVIKKVKKVKFVRKEIEEKLVDNFSILIKRKREEKGWEHKDLSKIIAEKESVIGKIENGSFKPSLNLAKKIGRVLGIKLVEFDGGFDGVIDKVEGSSLTIGDFVKRK